MKTFVIRGLNVVRKTKNKYLDLKRAINIQIGLNVK